MASLERRVELLEERRLQATIDLLFERARAASLDDVAQFLMVGYELEQKPELDEEDELRLWGHLGIPLEAVRLAEGRPELWHAQLGDLLGGRRGLQEHFREHHPEFKEKLRKLPERERRLSSMDPTDRYLPLARRIARQTEEERLAEERARQQAIRDQQQRTRRELARLRGGRVVPDHEDADDEDDIVRMHLEQPNYWPRTPRR